MSQIHITPSGEKLEYQKSLFYRVWFLADQKWHSLFLAAVLIAVVVSVARLTDSLLGGFLAFCVLLTTLWSRCLPTLVEMNSEGIVQTVLGRKKFIAWEDIRSYERYRDGILLLPRKTRFFLEAFRGYYLPVPPAMMGEVQFRFQVYVDRSPA